MTSLSQVVLAAEPWRIAMPENPYEPPQPPEDVKKNRSTSAGDVVAFLVIALLAIPASLLAFTMTCSTTLTFTIGTDYGTLPLPVGILAGAIGGLAVLVFMIWLAKSALGRK